MNLQPGEKIAVYDERRVELGEGTLIRVEKIPGLDMTAYECREHTILAKGTHYVRTRGKLVKIAT